MKTGIQLYCVKDVLEKDFEAGMHLAAGAGYDGIETYQLYDGVKADDYRREMDAAGVVCCGTHNQLSRLKNDLCEVMEYNRILGNDTIICHWLFPEERNNLDKVKAVARDLNEIGEILRKNGFRLLYHNHDFEFRGTYVGTNSQGKTIMDILLRDTDPLLMGIEFHASHVAEIGVDPAEYALALGERLKYLHVSLYDRKGNPAPEECERIMKAGIQAGVEWAVFEHVYPADVTVETLRDDMRRFRLMA